MSLYMCMHWVGLLMTRKGPDTKWVQGRWRDWLFGTAWSMQNDKVQNAPVETPVRTEAYFASISCAFKWLSCVPLRTYSLALCGEIELLDICLPRFQQVRLVQAIKSICRKRECVCVSAIWHVPFSDRLNYSLTCLIHNPCLSLSFTLPWSFLFRNKRHKLLPCQGIGQWRRSLLLEFSQRPDVPHYKLT